jgi:hypothetical protein
MFFDQQLSLDYRREQALLAMQVGVAFCPLLAWGLLRRSRLLARVTKHFLFCWWGWVLARDALTYSLQ